MGRLTFSRVLVAIMLVGGVAVAQQGLIVEPWRRAPALTAAPVRGAPTRAVPGSGLAPVSVAPVVRRLGKPTPAPIAAPLKWSPAVLELLVDPWARSPLAVPTATPAPAARPAAPARPHWLPASMDSAGIVDPWADGAGTGTGTGTGTATRPPRVASRASSVQHSTIF